MDQSSAAGPAQASAGPGAGRYRLGAFLAALLAGAGAAALALLGTVPGAGTAAASTSPPWTQLSPASSPPGRSAAAMAYDAGTGQLVLFGGVGSTLYLGDTWSFGAGTWTNQDPTSSPAARTDPLMAYDPDTGQLVLFGGFRGLGGPGYYGDTWTWNGSTWTQLSPATSPHARDESVMAYDARTGQLVLFGGTDGSILDDTWTWNGSTWTQLSPATSPPARTYSSMAYDPATGQLVLFGGESSAGSILDDTWTWNGSTWTQLSPATSPPARSQESIAYDPAAGQLVLFGGTTGGSNYEGDTWAWNGNTWTQLSPATSPTGRVAPAMAYDSGTGQLVLFGGDASSGYLADTWDYDATTQACATTTGGAATSCTVSTSLTVGAGTLGLEASPALYWDAVLDGYDQWASASSSQPTGCQASASGTACSGGSAPELEVLDDSGSGDGWALSAYLASSNLPAGSELDVNGSGSTAATAVDDPLGTLPFVATTPSTTCDDGSTCVHASPATSCSHTGLGFSSCPGYPVGLTGGDPSNQLDLYSASAGSGLGAVCLAAGSATGIGCAGTIPSIFYELGLPADVDAGSYSSTVIALTVSSGP